MMIDGDLDPHRPVDGEAALAVTLDWLRGQDSTNEFGALVREPLDASGLPDTLAEYLAAGGLKDWRDAIVKAASSGQPRHLEPRLGWLMWRAAFEIAVASEHPALFWVVEKLQMLGDVSDGKLASTVCSHVTDVSEGHPIFMQLRARLQVIWDSRFNERLRRYAEATAGLPLTSRDLWSRDDGTLIGDGWAHQIAATLWPERYMELLASYPAQFQHCFGERLSQLDLDLVTSLIRASPSVFSHEGVPLGPVVVFDLLEAVETRFTTIAAQDMAAAEIGIGCIIDSLFSRSDGDWIARAWLQQVIWRDTPRRAGRAQADVSAQRSLRDSLIVQLSTRITPFGEAIFDWVRQEEPLWGVHRVLSEASILEAHSNAAGAAEILSEAVRQGLVSATGRPAALVTSSPEASIVARVLSNLPDMKQWFETLWRDTYELREQLSYPAHRDLDNPAYPALTWGLIGLNSSQATLVDTPGLWRTIGGAVFETQRIDPNAGLFNGAMPPITRVTVQLGAALVKLGVLPIEYFADFLADQLEPTAEHARLWQIARSEAPDNLTLSAGRLVGSALLRQALEAGLAQHRLGHDAVLDRSTLDDLANFSSRL